MVRVVNSGVETTEVKKGDVVAAVRMHTSTELALAELMTEVSNQAQRMMEPFMKDVRMGTQRARSSVDIESNVKKKLEEIVVTAVVNTEEEQREVDAENESNVPDTEEDQPTSWRCSVQWRCCGVRRPRWRWRTRWAVWCRRSSPRSTQSGSAGRESQWMRRR